MGKHGDLMQGWADEFLKDKISSKTLKKCRALAEFWEESPEIKGWASIVLHLVAECERLRTVNEEQRRKISKMRLVDMYNKEMETRWKERLNAGF